VIDRAGRVLDLGELSPTQQDQLYLALTLALVSSFGSRAIDLPLVLDEPFLRQDAAGAATMSGVLDEFAREGRQVLVFTEDREGCEQASVAGRRDPRSRCITTRRPNAGRHHISRHAPSRLFRRRNWLRNRRFVSSRNSRPAVASASFDRPLVC